MPRIPPVKPKIPLTMWKKHVNYFKKKWTKQNYFSPKRNRKQTNYPTTNLME